MNTIMWPQKRSVQRVPAATIQPSNGANRLWLNVHTLAWLNQPRSVDVKIDRARNRLTITDRGQYYVGTGPGSYAGQFVTCPDVKFMPHGRYIAVPGEENVYELNLKEAHE